MDWQFKPSAKSSLISGESFCEGDRIECLIYLDTDGVIQRADLKNGERETFVAPGRLLGSWSRIVKAPDDERREAQKQALANSEEVFLSLFAEGIERSDEQDTLKQILALLLERKRILRSLGIPQNGVQRYLHVKSKEMFSVPMRNLSGENKLVVQSQLESFVI